MRTAHAVLTEMVEKGTGYLLVTVVEDIDTLRGELAAIGVTARLHAPLKISAREVRERTGLSQEDFALRYGLDVSTLRDWEQEVSEPDVAAATLLWVISRNPSAVEQARRRRLPARLWRAPRAGNIGVTARAGPRRIT